MDSREMLFLVVKNDSEIEINHTNTGIDIIVSNYDICRSISFQLDFEQVEKLKEWLNQTNKNNE